MGGRDLPPLRGLPRFFVEGVPDPAPARLPIPPEELHKIRHVLRLRRGDGLALLPGDGRLLRCTLQGDDAELVATERPASEPARRVRLAVALSKPDALEAALRMATEVGAASYVLFPSARSVVRWSPQQVESKLERLRRIVREAAEVAYRTRLPEVSLASGLESVLEGEWWALSESESAPASWPPLGPAPTVLVGPEGGWSPEESQKLQGRELSLGPRVLRVPTAAAVGVAAVLSAPPA